MATATPRRPSTNNLNELYTPPPDLARRASSVLSAGSSRGAGSPALGGTTDRKKRTRNLLRDYYGLAGGEAKKQGDPLDIDSPTSFNPDAYFQSISSTASLAALLDKENELLTEIRELDGERQSIVYNHHHELIEASATIQKMKFRAEALDSSLDALKTSFQSISQLSAAVASPYPDNLPRPNPPPRSSSSGAARMTNSSRTLSDLKEDPQSPTKSPRKLDENAAEEEVVFDPLIHLQALLSLPVLLRTLLAKDKSKADALWGKFEPALRSFEDEKVEGVREIGQECREVLRERRRSSVGRREDALKR